jgi:hypothetical protein
MHALSREIVRVVLAFPGALYAVVYIHGTVLFIRLSR